MIYDAGSNALQICGGMGSSISRFITTPKSVALSALRMYFGNVKHQVNYNDVDSDVLYFRCVKCNERWALPLIHGRCAVFVNTAQELMASITTCRGYALAATIPNSPWFTYPPVNRYPKHA